MIINRNIIPHIPPLQGHTGVPSLGPLRDYFLLWGARLLIVDTVQYTVFGFWHGLEVVLDGI